MVPIKICGVRGVEDAQRLFDIGIWAIGIIFCSYSKRFISENVARDISVLGRYGTNLVGVFCDHALEDIVKIAFELKLDYVQLHGDSYDRACIDILVGRAVKVIKVFSFAENLQDCITDFVVRCPQVKDILIDGVKSGSGMVWDFEVLKNLVIPSDVRLIIAGGVNLYNIENIAKLRNEMYFDVASGSEKMTKQGEIVKDFDVIKGMAGILKAD